MSCYAVQLGTTSGSAISAGVSETPPCAHAAPHRHKGQHVALLHRLLYNGSSHRVDSGGPRFNSVSASENSFPLLSLFYIIHDPPAPPARIVRLMLCAITTAGNMISAHHNCYLPIFHRASINVPLHFVKGRPHILFVICLVSRNHVIAVQVTSEKVQLSILGNVIYYVARVWAHRMCKFNLKSRQGQSARNQKW